MVLFYLHVFLFESQSLYLRAVNHKKETQNETQKVTSGLEGCNDAQINMWSYNVFEHTVKSTVKKRHTLC